MGIELKIGIAALAYAALARLVLWHLPVPRAPVFAGLNLFFFALLFYGGLNPYPLSVSRLDRAAFLLAYVGMVACQWLLIRVTAQKPGNAAAPAFLFPICVLLVMRYAPQVFNPMWAHTHVQPEDRNIQAFFVGLSYMAFRLTYLTLEVRSGSIEVPSLCRYLGFAFFVPTLAVGPISPYKLFERSLAAPDRRATPLGRSALRVLVGATKYEFLGNVLNQLTYAGLVHDGRTHPKIDWVVSMFTYYPYLYCNFSGFCDIAIGMAGLMGFVVHENFDSPFLARNPKDFWNRWHITLSLYMRDMVFTPLSKALIRVAGRERQNHVIAFSSLVLFVIVGVWHGTGIRFFLFGLAHGVAFVLHHYYSIYLRNRLGPKKLKVYLANRYIRFASVVVTFAYVSGSLAIFAGKDTRGHTRADELREAKRMVRRAAR